MARVSLASPLESRSGNNTKDSRTINGLLESAGEQNGVIKRPGNYLVGSVTSGDSQCLAELNSKVLTIIGDSLKINIVSPFSTDSTTTLSPLYGGLLMSSAIKGRVSNSRSLMIKTIKEGWIIT